MWSEEGKGQYQTDPFTKASLIPQVESRRPHLRKGGGSIGPEKRKKKEAHAGSILVTGYQSSSFLERQEISSFCVSAVTVHSEQLELEMSWSDPCCLGVP